MLFLILFIAVYLLINFYPSKKDKTESSYFLASRKLGIFPLIATLVVSQYGWINGVFEMYLLDGPKAWFILSLPYLVFNLIWVYLGKFLHQQSALSTPQLFSKNYGKPVGTIAALLLTIIFLPIMYVHMGASVLNQSFGLTFEWGTMLFIFLSSLSIFTGGFKRVVFSDIFLFILTYVGLIVTLLYLSNGSPWSTGEFIATELKVEVIKAPAYSSYLGWWLLALIVFIDPSIHQRLWAANNAKQVNKIMLGSVFFWLLFDLLVIGIISQNKSSVLITDVFGISELLPKSISMLFKLMLLAVILSTTNTYFNITFNNIAFEILNLKTKLKGSVICIAGLMMLTCYGMVIYVYQSSSVIQILFDLFPAVISALFLPFISIFSVRFKISNNAAFIQIISSALVCLFFQINIFKWTNFATEIPVAAGLLFSLAFQITILLLWAVQKETKN